jgi:ABC-type amino acid transport substrate-binding protein
MKRNSLNKRLACVAALLLFGILQSTQADPETIKQNGTLEIAVYAKFPPYSAKTGGKVRGVDVAIGQALAKKLDVVALG